MARISKYAIVNDAIEHLVAFNKATSDNGREQHATRYRQTVKVMDDDGLRELSFIKTIHFPTYKTPTD
jgi:hypothetical protein